MSVLRRVQQPADLRGLTPAELTQLCAEIRDFLVQKVARTGGHLGPNLGAVELTIALHRVFDSPSEPILFDTGHQAYVHKMLTGRQAGFDQLTQTGGLSGYPSRAESPHDWIENSHASTALSYADGMAKAFEVRGERRPVVAVVGDGALTGGMCWEALNNIAAADRPVIIVVNDNGRSYAPTSGRLAERLAGLRLRPGYERMLGSVKTNLPRVPVVGPPLYETLHGMKRGMKDLLAPQGMFEDFGLKYVGPVDGHDLAAIETALRQARQFDGPVVVHCVTRKGYGYRPAEDDEADQMHGPGAFDPQTGRLLSSGGRRWTGVFADELVRDRRAARRRRRDHRGDVRADRAQALRRPLPRALLRRRHRRAARDDLGGRAGLGRPAPGRRALRDLPQPGLRPAADGRRPAPAAGDGRARPGRPDRRRRRRATTACGISRCSAWCPGMRIAAPRDEPTLRAELREAVDARRRPDRRCATRRRRSATTSRPLRRSAGSTCWPSRMPTPRSTCWWSRSAPRPPTCSRRPARCAGPGSPCGSSIRAG